MNGYPFEKPVACLAPMDGYTDIAFRQIVRGLNPEVVLFSEFTSIDGIKHSEKVKNRLDFDTRQLPYIIQLFGNDPDSFFNIIKSLQDKGASGFDINMGCPSKRIIKGKCGAFLIKEQDLACRIVEASVKATDLPVSVKTRLGWKDTSDLFGFAKALESAGAKMITVHGRTYSQGFRGSAEFSSIYELKEKINIPLILNGDLKNKEDAETKLQNLDGYMIGRAAIGNPWCFWDHQRRDQLSLKDKIEVMIEHFTLLRKYKAESLALIEFRKHISGYISGFQNAKAFRRLLMQSGNELEFTKNALSLV